jgi:hypothetical protein
VVECNLAKVDVEGSNPFSRSKPTRAAMRTSQSLAVKRWLRGQAAAAIRSREASAEAGPDPRQAVAVALSAVNALADMGVWPGPRDPASEAAVVVVRKRWATIQLRAMRDRAR